MSFNTTDYKLDEQKYPSRLATALGALFGFLFITFGLFGNFLISLAILSKPKLRINVINIFIVSLQLNDIFNIICNCIPVAMSYAFMKWHSSYKLCEIFVYTSIIGTGCLLWHHAIISMHRYVVVVYNQRQNVYCMNMRQKVSITFSLTISRLIPVLVCTPALYSRNLTVYNSVALRCMLAPNVSSFQNLLIVLVNMIIPCTIVTFCFAKIFFKIRKTSFNLKNSNNITFHMSNQQASEIINLYSNTENNSKCISTIQYPTGNMACSQKKSLNLIQREIKITRMFALIFLVFLFGYLPYGIIRLIDGKNNLDPDVYIFLTVIFIISITISPFMYGLMNKSIRLQCLAILKKLIRRPVKKDLMEVQRNEISVSHASSVKRSLTNETLKFKLIEDNDEFHKENNNGPLINVKQRNSDLESKVANDTKLSKDNSKKIVVNEENATEENKSIRSKSYPLNSQTSKTSVENRRSLKQHTENCENVINKFNFDVWFKKKDDGGIYKGPDYI